MSQDTKQKFHPQILTEDLPDIAKRFETGQKQEFLECQQLINNALRKIQMYPDKEGKPCIYEPLSTAGFRKVNIFSKRKVPKGETPDLRIIYRYNIQDDAIEVLSIGFRVKERPRPPEDPYSRSGKRDHNFIF